MEGFPCRTISGGRGCEEGVFTSWACCGAQEPSFWQGGSVTAGILHYEKPSGLSCSCPMGSPRSVILTVLWQYAEFSFLHDLKLWGMYPPY